MRGEAFPNEHHWLLTHAYDEPLPLAEGRDLPAIDSLWARARDFFARILRETGPLEIFARRARVRPPQRGDLMKWLRPVELVTRSLILARAIALLLTTEEGARLMSATPKRTLAERFGLAPPAKTSHCESIPHPGLHTLADRNARLAAIAGGRIDAPEPEPPPEPRPAEQSNELTSNQRAFRVLNWRLTGEGREQKAALNAPKRKLILTFEDLDKDTDRPDEPDDAGEPESGRFIPQGLAMAARIDALGRVLENPDATIRRVAKQLAAFDRETCFAFDTPIIPPHTWSQGERECHQSMRWFNRSLGDFNRRLDSG